MYASLEGSGEFAHTRRLARAFDAHRCDKNRNLTDAIRTKILWTIILLLSEYGMKFQIIGYFIGKGYQADDLVETKINLLILHKTYEPAHMNKAFKASISLASDPIFSFVHFLLMKEYTSPTAINILQA